MFLVMLFPKGLPRCADRLASGPCPVACAAMMKPAHRQRIIRGCGSSSQDIFSQSCAKGALFGHAYWYASLPTSCRQQDSRKPRSGSSLQGSSVTQQKGRETMADAEGRHTYKGNHSQPGVLDLLCLQLLQAYGSVRYKKSCQTVPPFTSFRLHSASLVLLVAWQ